MGHICRLLCIDWFDDSLHIFYPNGLDSSLSIAYVGGSVCTHHHISLQHSNLLQPLLCKIQVWLCRTDCCGCDFAATSHFERQRFRQPLHVSRSSSPQQLLGPFLPLCCSATSVALTDTHPAGRLIGLLRPLIKARREPSLALSLCISLIPSHDPAEYENDSGKHSTSCTYP